MQPLENAKKPECVRHIETHSVILDEVRRSASRRIAGRSRTIVSKQPAAVQRCVCW